MELDRFIGIWENKAGKRLEIKRKDKKSLNVSFYNQGRIPIMREYFNNSETINMHAELDSERSARPSEESVITVPISQVQRMDFASATGL